MNRAAASLVFRATRSNHSFAWNGPVPHFANNIASTRTSATPSPIWKRAFSSLFGKYYHIEADNAERSDATRLTVTGPDVDGILASMTVTLAVKGCSLVELHAGRASDCSHDHVVEDTHLISDTFYVVQRETGQPFPDDALNDLATSLLEAAKTPMKAVGMTGSKRKIDILEAYVKENVKIPETQITVIPSTNKE